MSGVARGLEREDEVIGRLAAPFLKRRGGLGPVEGAVDLDRRQMSRRKGELLLLRQTRRVESSPPRLIGPPSDADSDPSRHEVDYASGVALQDISHTFKRARNYGPYPANSFMKLRFAL